ncbi:TPA: hypothetical protein IBX06_004606, partial [Escherichia coli]|nr:hypothetical protein [Escherichia coli]HAM4818439.1 hypothetical protein [Escherichia coli]HAM4823302.1 hypothetical protein [Escherichia coli]HAM4842162.1 hypothetical protein [Escherichia coli]HAM4861457.1 hypothetical protein [Escherichia coli]
VEVGFGFKAFGQFSRKGFKFLFVHRLPVSVVGVNISKTGNYTILITVSHPKIDGYSTLPERHVIGIATYIADID